MTLPPKFSLSNYVQLSSNHVGDTTFFESKDVVELKDVGDTTILESKDVGDTAIFESKDVCETVVLESTDVANLPFFS